MIDSNIWHLWACATCKSQVVLEPSPREPQYGREKFYTHTHTLQKKTACHLGSAHHLPFHNTPGKGYPTRKSHFLLLPLRSYMAPFLVTLPPLFHFTLPSPVGNTRLAWCCIIYFELIPYTHTWNAVIQMYDGTCSAWNPSDLLYLLLTKLSTFEVYCLRLAAFHS